MADERIVTELVVEGAQRSVRQIEVVQQATTQLLSVQESVGVRQRGIYDSVSRAAERAAQAEADAAKRAAEAIKQAEEQSTKTVVEQAAKRAEARRNEGVAAVERVQQIGGGQRLTGLTERIQQPTPAPIDNQSIRASVTVSQQARNATIAQAQAAQTLQGRLAALGTVIQGVVTQTTNLIRTNLSAVNSQGALSGALNNSSRQGITYLSVLSAIHAASFLTTNQTFSMLGSFLTLGAAFGKLGLAAGVIGLSFAGILGLFGQLQKGVELVNNIINSAAKSMAGLAVAVLAAATAATAASVQTASGIESQLASVRAFGGATAAQLIEVSKQAEELSIRFGVSARDIVEATSLFARAGGSVEDAIKGATQAIVELQVASQGELSAAQAAIVVSAALKQFSLTGEQAARVADNLAAAMQGSALSALGVQQAFIQAAPGAAALGLSIEDVSSAVALLGDQLIKGTTTGTAFKQFILDIVNPTQQAQKALAAYGISLRDGNNNALPFFEALEQLNKGLSDNVIGNSEAARAARAQALSIAFGSRAFLAANILTREGTEGLDRYRQKLNETTTNNIVNVLLLPLNKQLERLGTTVDALRARFGGPLLEPLRVAVAGIITALSDLRPAAEVAGQALSTILTGQGFGQLQAKINDLISNDSLRQFFLEIVNVGRNVVDVIVTQIIPAVQTFFATISGALGDTSAIKELGTSFTAVNVAIQAIGGTIATAIKAFGQLLAEMIKNEGQGRILREALKTLATTLLTQVAAGISTTLTLISAAIIAMPVFARVALLSAQAALGFAGAFKEIALKAIDAQSAIDIFAAGQLANAAASRGDTAAIREQANRVKEIQAAAERSKTALAQETGAAQQLAKEIQDTLPQLDRLAAGIQSLGNAPAAAVATLQKSIDQLTIELIEASGTSLELLTDQEVDQFRAKAQAIHDAARQQVGGVVTIFDEAGGNLSTIISNIQAEIAQRLRDISTDRPTGGVVVPIEVDDAAIKKARDRIAEATRDLGRRLEHLAEDSATKVNNAINRALERMDDIFQNAQDRLDELAEQTRERIDDLVTGVAERRADRGALKEFTDAQEDRFTIFQRELDKEVTAEDRALETISIARQRNNEDIARDKEQEIQDNERVFSRLQDSAQRAFDRVQQARELAFDRQQDIEATAFQRQLDRESQLRDFQKQLAGAKTPEERTQVLQQQQETIKDVSFRQNQEDRLTAFRLKQEEKKRKFSQDQETQGLNFKIGLEDRALKVRRDNELALLAFRRQAEDKERQTREAEEDRAIERRLAREDRILERRKSDAVALQKFQDDLEDAANQRQIDKINREAEKQDAKIRSTALKQAQEVADSIALTLQEQALELDRNLRNIRDTFKDLRDDASIQAVLPAVAAQLNAAETSLLEQQQAALGKLETTISEAQLRVDQARAVGEAELTVRPTVGAQPPGVQQQIPARVITAQTMNVANLVLPPGFTRGLSDSWLEAMRRAEAEGVVLQGRDVDLVPIVAPLQQVLRYLTGGR